VVPPVWRVVWPAKVGVGRSVGSQCRKVPQPRPVSWPGSVVGWVVPRAKSRPLMVRARVAPAGRTMLVGQSSTSTR
jgi:hypothetical protein